MVVWCIQTRGSSGLLVRVCTNTRKCGWNSYSYSMLYSCCRGTRSAWRGEERSGAAHDLVLSGQLGRGADPQSPSFRHPVRSHAFSRPSAPRTRAQIRTGTYFTCPGSKSRVREENGSRKKHEAPLSRRQPCQYLYECAGILLTLPQMSRRGHSWILVVGNSSDV